MMWKKFMLSCKKATELMEKRNVVPLSFKERLQLNMHKKMCDICSMYEKQSKFIDNALTTHYKNHPVDSTITLDESIKKKIQERIKNL